MNRPPRSPAALTAIIRPFYGSIVTPLRELASYFTRRRETAPEIRFADFSETLPDEQLPYLDRSVIDDQGLTADQRAWRRDGVLALRGFIPDEITAPYIARREALGRLEGWLNGQPYLHVPEMRGLALYPPLMAKLQALIGERMMLHLCLTSWMTTHREWHQDDYLNPDFVSCWYCAVWIALGEIGPDCGPFQYIPGSHRWPLIRGEKVRALLPPEQRGALWAKHSERIITPAVEHELRARRTPPVSFLAKRGDVLIWHSRLIHQGSKAKVLGTERRALIAHYSGTNHRPDITEAMRHRDANGEIYVDFGKEVAEAGVVQGYVDAIAGRQVIGWSRDAAFPARSVVVEAVLDDEVLAHGVADLEYPALAHANFPDHDHGFTLTLPRELSPEEAARLTVRAVEGRTLIERAPPYQGYVDVRTSGRVVGWVRNRFAAGERVAVQVMLGDKVIAEGEAGEFHDDLNISHGFNIAYPRELSATERDAVRVRIKHTKDMLELSPMLIVEA